MFDVEVDDEVEVDKKFDDTVEVDDEVAGMYALRYRLAAVWIARDRAELRNADRAEPTTTTSAIEC